MSSDIGLNSPEDDADQALVSELILARGNEDELRCIIDKHRAGLVTRYEEARYVGSLLMTAIGLFEAVLATHPNRDFYLKWFEDRVAFQEITYPQAYPGKVDPSEQRS